MRLLILLSVCLVFAPPAFAHGDGLPISPAEIGHHWNFDPLIWAPLLVAHWLFGRGVLRARRQAKRIFPLWRAASFMTGEALLVVALISPLDPLGETLLSAHMAQHIILMSLAPPLLVLGQPMRALTWSLPRSWRRVGATAFVRGVNRGVVFLSRPMLATVLSIAVMWIWHAPMLFEAALADESIHTLEHATFFVSGLLVWEATLSSKGSAIAASASILVVFMAGGMLGGLLCLAPVAIYDWYGNWPLLWGVTPAEDQQLAGLMMWVLAGGVYLLAFVAMVLRVMEPDFSRRSQGIIRASTSSRSMK